MVISVQLWEITPGHHDTMATIAQVMMEYILIADVNSSDHCAHRLGELLAQCRALVMLNIIPYNPTAAWWCECGSVLVDV